MINNHDGKSATFSRPNNWVISIFKYNNWKGMTYYSTWEETGHVFQQEAYVCGLFWK